jgi:hypothetical protein
MPSLFRLDNRRSGKASIRLLALFLALAIAAPTLFAQEWDHMVGRDKANDPIGAWIVTDTSGPGTDGSPGVLTTFHNDGTTSATVRGDAIGPIFFSPEHGVWKKTGNRTFTATFVALEYNGDGIFIGIFEVDANFRLHPSGDQYDSNFVAYETLANGKVNNFGSGTSHGVRITVKPPAL